MKQKKKSDGWRAAGKVRHCFKTQTASGYLPQPVRNWRKNQPHSDEHVYHESKRRNSLERKKSQSRRAERRSLRPVTPHDQQQVVLLSSCSLHIFDRNMFDRQYHISRKIEETQSSRPSLPRLNRTKLSRQSRKITSSHAGAISKTIFSGALILEMNSAVSLGSYRKMHQG